MCSIDWGIVSNVTGTFLLALVAYINYRAFVRFSNINVSAALQQQMLTKAKECNILIEKAEAHRREFGPPQTDEWYYVNVVTEIIISIQLLDSSLEILPDNKKRKEKRRVFFLRQFWIQLNTDIRRFIKRKQSDGINDEAGPVLHKQIEDVILTFDQFFKDY